MRLRANSAAPAPRARGAVAVEVTLVSLVLAAALFLPLGPDGAVSELILTAMQDFWRAFARMVTVL